MIEELAIYAKVLLFLPFEVLYHYDYIAQSCKISHRLPDFIKVKNVSLEEGGDLLPVLKDISQMIENCRGKKTPVIIFRSVTSLGLNSCKFSK